MINFDFETYSNKIISSKLILKTEKKLTEMDTYFETYKDFTGFRNLEELFNDTLLNEIQLKANEVKSNYDVLLVAGIGGSYMGSKALIEALKPYFYNEDAEFKVYFVGNSLNYEYLDAVLEKVKDKKVCLNIISKSGTTFEIVENVKLIKEKVNLISKDIIYTSSNDLFKEKENFFKIPENIGGRFSVFTPVALLPLAIIGVDLKELKRGATDGQNDILNQKKYASIRHLMEKKGSSIELFVTYDKKLYYFLEWIKQLYGESLGKNNKGLFPASIINTTDLHSLGQFIQEGPKCLFETVITVSKEDTLMDKHNSMASLATSTAHYDDKVLNNLIKIDNIDEYHLAYLMQFLMETVAYNGKLSKVHPYNQPGVEKYKSEMKKLLKED